MKKKLMMKKITMKCIYLIYSTKKKEPENIQKSDYKVRNGTFFSRDNIRASLSLRPQTTMFSDFENILNLDLNRNFSMVEKVDKNKILNKYDEIVDKNKNILELMFIVILGIIRLNKLNTLDLIMSDCYYKEFINSFGLYYSSNSKLPTCINSFHLLTHL